MLVGKFNPLLRCVKIPKDKTLYRRVAAGPSYFILAEQLEVQNEKMLNDTTSSVINISV